MKHTKNFARFTKSQTTLHILLQKVTEKEKHSFTLKINVAKCSQLFLQCDKSYAITTEMIASIWR